MFRIQHIKEALRFVKNSLHKIRKFEGSAEQICKQIIESCWNNNYFQTSLGNYPGFYCRDFGMCCESLINLDYEDEVFKTLVYALETFRLNNNITTNITKDNIAIDCFSHTPESLAFILNCLRLLGNKSLVDEYKDFLEKQAMYVFDNDFDKETSLLRKDKRFSSMKDNSIRVSSCYNNCMLAMLSNNLDKLNLANPFKDYDIKKAIKKHFWFNGFIDDLGGNKVYSGDANTFPYWCNVFTDKKMWKISLKRIQEQSLDKPFPLKYTKDRIKSQEMSPMKYFIPNWEGNTIWCHLGMCFIETVNKFDKNLTNQYLDQYKQIIETNKNFIEMFNPDGSLYKNMFYKSDSGMLWGSKYLTL